MFNNDGIGSEGKLRVIASNGDSFKKVLDVNVAPSAIASTSLTWGDGDLVAIGGKVALLSIPLGTTYFLVHHIYAFMIHVMVLILLKGVLFARSSHLISDKEVGEYEIRVNCISPYAVSTPLLLNMSGVSNKKKTEETISRNG
ncbi:hypothetical protein Gotur_035547, partial [Gossypium turneri]